MTKQEREAGLLAALRSKKLKGFAYKLSRGHNWQEDLIQETALNAWAALDRFDDSASIMGWLYVIMRNTSTTMWRKTRLEVELPEDRFWSGEDADDMEMTSTAFRVQLPRQIDHLRVLDLVAGISKLSPKLRLSLLAIRWEGISNEEASVRFAVPVGTIKSRASRARTALADMMQDSSLLSL